MTKSKPKPAHKSAWHITAMLVGAILVSSFLFLFMIQAGSSVLDGNKIIPWQALLVNQKTVQEKTILEKTNDVLRLTDSSKKRIDAVGAKIPRQASDLRKIVNDAANKNNEYSQKLKVAADDFEKESVLHMRAYDRIEEKIIYAEKMASLPKILRDTSVIVNQLEKENNLLKNTRFYSATTAKATSSFKKYSAAINKLYIAGDTQKTAELIEKMRAEILPSLMQYEMVKKSDPTAIKLNSLTTQFKRKLQLDFPYTIAELESTTTRPSESPSTLPPAKVYNVMVCLMRWNTDPIINATSNYTTNTTANFTSLKAELEPALSMANEYFREISYNQAAFSFTYSNGVWPGGTLPDNSDAEMAVAVEACGYDESGNRINYGEVDKVILYPSLLLGSTPSTSGRGRPRRTIVTPTGSFVLDGVHLRKYSPNEHLSATIIHNWLSTTTIHEFGHTFNLPHANALKCLSPPSKKQLSPSLQRIPTCTSMEYYNIFDVMGLSEFGGHISGFYKAMAGWGYFRAVHTDGTYALGALETSTNKPVSLMIRTHEKGKPINKMDFCIEYRKPIGWDNFAHRQLNAENIGIWQDLAAMLVIPSEGCILVDECTAPTRDGRQLNLLDTTPNSRAANLGWIYDLPDTCIPKNTPYTEPKTGLVLQWRPSTTATNTAAVTIDMPSK